MSCSSQTFITVQHGWVKVINKRHRQLFSVPNTVSRRLWENVWSHFINIELCHNIGVTLNWSRMCMWCWKQYLQQLYKTGGFEDFLLLYHNLMFRNSLCSTSICVLVTAPFPLLFLLAFIQTYLPSPLLHEHRDGMKRLPNVELGL